jgi:hypothetical protein
MESAADLVIDTTNLPVADVAERIEGAVGLRIAAGADPGPDPHTES